MHTAAMYWFGTGVDSISTGRLQLYADKTQGCRETGGNADRIESFLILHYD
jgi:hypothetical protein